MISPFPEIDIDNSIVNDIVDVILNRYRTAVDNSDRLVFGNDVDRGLYIPNGTPTEGVNPFVRIWENTTDVELKTVQMVDAYWNPLFSIFIGFCAHPDISGQYADCQQFRNNLAKFSLRCLNTPSAGEPNGITPNNKWSFTNPQNVRIDFAAPLQRIGIDVPILPPWYMFRLDISARAFNL